MKFILGEKIEMSQLYRESGEIVPVTLVRAKDCYVSKLIGKVDGEKGTVVLGVMGDQVKGANKDKKAKDAKVLKGFKVDNLKEYKKDQEIKIDQFVEGDKISVFGISKGKGFQGVVKKYNFGGDLKTHGRAHSLRKGGSIASKRLSKVAKGRKMPGRMGGQRKVVHGLEIVSVDKDNGIYAVKGAVPGVRGSLVEIIGK